MVSIDTHASVKRLQATGLTEEQAEAIVEVFLSTAGVRPETDLAAKTDIARLKTGVTRLMLIQAGAIVLVQFWMATAILNALP